MNKFFTLAAFFIICLTLSCHRPKLKVPAPSAGREEIEKFIVKEINFRYFSSKAKINFKDEKEDINASVHIRIKKDSIIWLSITPGLGIEALRVLIRPDSIFMLNKIKDPNAYSAYGFNFLNKQFNIDLTFQNLQAMILGNLPIPKSYDDMLTKNETSAEFILQQKTPGIGIKNHVEIATMKLRKLEMNQTGTQNKLNIEYFNFAPLDTVSFPYGNLISIDIYKNQVAKNTTITISHNKTEISDKELNFPFNVPKRYEKR
ncbi:MAG TPA: DUF4292 domain-containing protein [Cytophagaceae bacterium]|jgi:hypothetical protein|nr:DUF4292 domain-containing protein [Cytophagaceae bacterium]